MGVAERSIKGSVGLANMIATVFGAKASVKPKVQTHVTPPKLPAPVNTAAEVVQESGEAVAKVKSLTDYSHIADPKNLTASTKPTPRQVRQMKEANRAQNGGVLRDDVTGEVGVDSSKSMKGVTPPSNSIEVDHFIPVDGGGTRAQSNLRLLLKTNNRKKSNKIPE